MIGRENIHAGKAAQRSGAATLGHWVRLPTQV
jgi:hypothetical protein